MTLLYRRITYITFIIIFLILAPAAILYTQGFRYNFHYSRVQKTGIMIISSMPRRAQISLNGTVYDKDTTPTKVENMLPGDYEITLTKEGYHNWNKKLPIYENNTTFAEDVILWKDDYPVSISQTTSTDWLASPDNSKIAYISNNQVVFFDTTNNSFVYPADSQKLNKIKILGWSNTSKKIIIKNQMADITSYFVINSEQLPTPQLQKIINYSYESLKWDIDSDNIIYGLAPGSGWKIDLFQNKHDRLLTGQVDDFIIKDDKIFTLESGNLFWRSLGTNQLVNPLEEINCQNCKFINKKSSQLILFDNVSNQIYFVDPENRLQTIASQAKAINWLDDDTLLFYNDWEIWIYNLGTREPELITRLGQKIQFALWHTAGRHIIFVSNNMIKIIELDNRELRNVVELVTPEKITDWSIDSRGEILYFSGQLNNKYGFYSLNIR
ncbi:MAG TPA: PEGA domain-containing protein [Patescibacteria group bacterium]|nr:PEGA domain-containing protein [Patescibacteria group bacterium]